MIVHMTEQYTDKELLDGLRSRKRQCINWLYREFFPVTRHYVVQNSGNQQDVEDLFHDALVVLYIRSQSSSFSLECSLKTYFMSVCKNLWLQRLDRKYRLLYQAGYEVHEEKVAYSPDDSDLSEETLEQQRLFHKNLMLLPFECRRLLQLYCLKVPYREIAKMLNYKDEVYVKTRKYTCKKLLRKKIMSDPECQKYFTNGENRDGRQSG